MKLPDDPKERSQLLMLIGIFGIAALYGIYMAANVVLMKPQKDKQDEIKEIAEKLRKANGAIEMMPMMHKNNDSHIAIISEIDRQYILHPKMGNLLLPAEEFIREQETISEGKVLSVKEIGISAFPIPDPPAPVEGEAHAPRPAKKEYAFKIYTARVEVAEGLHNMVKLVKQIEAANPYICISSMNITPEEETPFTHRMSFDVQWPIWNANKVTEKIMKQLNSPAFRETIKETAAKKTAPKTKAKAAKSANTANSPEAAAELKGLGIPIDEN